MRQVSKAARYAVRGEEATRNGYPIAGFDMHDARDQAEIVAQTLGFTPREVSKGWEEYISIQQAVVYYETWRTGLLRQWNHAHETGDVEAQKVFNQEIRDYNKAVPFPEMRIGPTARRQSYETYIRTRRMNEKKLEQRRPFRRLASSIEKVFSDGEEEEQ